MSSGTSSSSNSGSQDPYSTLGIDSGASFDEIQKAKERCLLDVGDDPRAKAKIEASYDELLMVSLKERQLGKISNEAVSASRREESNVGALEDSSLLTRLKSFKLPNKDSSDKAFSPELSLPEGQGLTVRIAFGLLALILLMVSPKESIQIILSLSTLGLFVSQVRRGRKILPSLGWSVVLLSTGLILGGLLINMVSQSSILTTSLSKEHIEALPALFLLWLGSLLLA